MSPSNKDSDDDDNKCVHQVREGKVKSEKSEIESKSECECKSKSDNESDNSTFGSLFTARSIIHIILV